MVLGRVSGIKRRGGDCRCSAGDGMGGSLLVFMLGAAVMVGELSSCKGDGECVIIIK